MADYIDGRARQGSGPGLTLSGAVNAGQVLRGLGLGAAVRRAREAAGRVLCVTCGEPAQEATGKPVCLRCFASGRSGARELATARLSAAADDATELAQGFASDAVMWAGSMGSIPAGAEWDGLVRSVQGSAVRCARLTLRLCRQAAQLRETADSISQADEALPADVCLYCAERPVCPDSPAQDCCLACWLRRAQ